MVTDDRSASREPSSHAVNHDDTEWNAHKSNFFQCYIRDGMTLKEATNHMARTHNFPASERQWERKAKTWGFVKYTPAQQRFDQEKEGDSQGRNFKRWQKRHSRSRDSRGRSRSVSSGGLSPIAKDAYRGRSRTKSTSSGDQSADEKAYHRHRGSLGAQLLTPEDYKHTFFDLGLPPSEVQKLDSPILPDTFNIQATRGQPGSGDAVKLDVAQPFSQTGQDVLAPQLFLSQYDDATSQLNPIASIPFNHSDIATPYTPDPLLQMMPTEGVDATFDYNGLQTMPTDLEDQDFSPAQNGYWNSQMGFRSPVDASQLTMQAMGGDGSGTFPAIEPMEQLTEQDFETGLDPLSGPDFQPSESQLDSSAISGQAMGDATQRPRNDSLAATFVNSDDPFQVDLVTELDRYTSAVLDEVSGQLLRWNFSAPMIQKIRNDVSEKRYKFIYDMKVMVENQISNIKRQHQDEHDLCVRSRAREKIYRRLIQEEAPHVDIQAALNNSSSNASMNYWTQNAS